MSSQISSPPNVLPIDPSPRLWQRLSGLRALFEASEADKKSELIKSETFGDGRWFAFFYAQSGYDQVSEVLQRQLREDENQEMME